MFIALDFDGTVVEHRYPAIGKERPFAVATIKRLIEEGHYFILWTCREGRLLEEAVDWCKERGINFYAINKGYEEEKNTDSHFSRKPKVDMFIDDRNVGGLPDWGVIYQLISRGITYEQFLIEEGDIEPPKKKPWWKF